MTAAALCAVCLTADTGNKKELAVICEYLLEKKAPLYKDADVFIPAPVIFGIREKGGETLVFGNFWIFGYDLSGATLICESGGAMPACFHLAKDGDSYKVTKVEQAEDGAGFTDSIEKMTKGYKKIRKKMLVSNEKMSDPVQRALNHSSPAGRDCEQIRRQTGRCRCRTERTQNEETGRTAGTKM